MTRFVDTGMRLAKNHYATHKNPIYQIRFHQFEFVCSKFCIDEIFLTFILTAHNRSVFIQPAKFASNKNSVCSDICVFYAMKSSENLPITLKHKDAAEEQSMPCSWALKPEWHGNQGYEMLHAALSRQKRLINEKNRVIIF